jgi:hypothetical protein
MGALSFATGTLASLSSAFSPKKNAIAARADNVSKFSVELDDNAQRIFTEFSTGMKMLYLHGSRNPCNITKITCQNLKLLHTNLKSNKSYRKIITDIRNGSVDTNHWTWLPLLSNPDITARILFLPAGTGISPNLTTPDNTEPHRESEPAVSNPAYSKRFRQLYLTLLGNAQLDFHIRGDASNIQLRTGDVFADLYEQNPVKRISAIKGNGLILNIEIPAT